VPRYIAIAGKLEVYHALLFSEGDFVPQKEEREKRKETKSPLEYMLQLPLFSMSEPAAVGVEGGETSAGRLGNKASPLPAPSLEQKTRMDETPGGGADTWHGLMN
jgi:hypothetical protein